MIIVRSPLRITLGGGGTDLPSYYTKHGGFCISAAINKYVYCSVLRPFTEGIYLKYSEIEKVKRVDEVQHPIIREVLKSFNLKTPQIEITTLADIPSGTGLGSSSSFTTALIKALFSHRRRVLSPYQLAEAACDIEISKLKSPIGKQDQYISSFGGITSFNFNTDNSVEVIPLSIKPEVIYDLEDNLLLFFTGFSRNANDILKIQDAKTKQDNDEMIENLHQIKDFGIQISGALMRGDLMAFSAYMNHHWEEKKKRSFNMTNPKIDEWYEYGLKNGAMGGKLVGAGGGGFLMFYASDNRKLRSAMKKIGLEEVRFNFDFDGAKLLL